MALPLAQIEGKYEILEKMHEGGMGAIYKVRHRLLEEIRVVKVLRSQIADDPGVKARFLREARAAVRLRHPNIAQLYDFSIDEEGTGYMVMEYIHGLNLAELLKTSGPPAIGLALEAGIQSLRALGYLHSKGFVHRDISPDNLMLTRDGEGSPHVKLIDLGIVKSLQSEKTLTEAGLFVGKVRYASPEHFGGTDGKSVVEARSDLYSMGIVLYELVTGSFPISGSDYSSILGGHLFRPPVPFEETDPTGRVPDGLRTAVLRSLAKQPEERFESAQAMSEALAEVLAGLPAEDDLDVSGTVILPLTEHSDERPGSTQDRLDVWFPLGGGPTPPPPATDIQGTEPGAEAQSEERLDALLSVAKRLCDLGHLDEARLQLDAVLGLDPENRTATSLMDEIAGQARQAEVRELVSTAHQTFAAGDEERARDAVQRALTLDPQHPEAMELLAELDRRAEERRDEQARREAAELAAVARARFDAGELDTAAEIASQAAAGGNEEAVALLDGIERIRAARASIEERLAVEALDDAAELLARAESDLGPGHLGDLGSLLEERRSLAAWVARGHELASAGELDEAELSVREVRAHDPGHEGARRLATEISNLRADRKERVEDLLRDARELADRQQLGAAMGALEEIGKLDPSDPRLETLGNHITALRRRTEAGNRLVAEVTSHLEAHRLGRAEAALRQRGDALVDEASAAAMEQRCRTARQTLDEALERAQLAAQSGRWGTVQVEVARILELDEEQSEARALGRNAEKQGRKEAKKHLAHAAKILETGEFDEVIELVSEARHLTDDASLGTDLLTRAVARRDRITTLTNAVERALGAGALEDASRLLAEVENDLAGLPPVVRLSDRIRIARDQAADALVAAIGRGEATDPESDLRRALELAPDHRDARRLLEELEAGPDTTAAPPEATERTVHLPDSAGDPAVTVHLHQESPSAPPARGEALERASAEIENALRSGQPHLASRLLQAALKTHGDQPLLRPLRDRVAELLLDQELEDRPTHRPPTELPSPAPRPQPRPRPRPAPPPSQPPEEVEDTSRAFPPLLWVVAVLVVVVGIGSVLWWLRPPPPPDVGTTGEPTAVTVEPADDGETSEPGPGVAPGRLVLDATPWAELLAIRGEDDASLPLPPLPYTPLILELPPGTYGLVLAAPDGTEKTLEVELQGGSEKRQLLELATVDVEAYLARQGFTGVAP